MAEVRLAGGGDAVTETARRREPREQGDDIAIFLKRAGEGGVARVACILASGFAEDGLATELILGRLEGTNERSLSKKVAVTTLSDECAGKMMLAYLPKAVATVAALAAHIRRAKPRILMSPGNHTHVTVALAHALARAAGDTRLVVKITNPIIKDRHGPLKRWYRTKLYRWILSRASSILVLSQGRVDQIAAMYPKLASKSRFVHNPYVTSLMREPSLDVAAIQSCAEPVILAVGRLVEQKNYALLLEAAARIVALRWRLVILGTGPQEQSLRTLAQNLGIGDRVEFTGFVADPTPYFRRAHLLALSSTYEDLPAVVLEALACGCPVVATACSDAVVSVLSEARYGSLVPPGDVAAFAEAVAGVLEHPPERRVIAGAFAYSVENGVAEHLGVLRPLLTRS